VGKFSDQLKKCWIQGMNENLRYTGQYKVINLPLDALDDVRAVLKIMPVVEGELDCYPCLGLDRVFWIRRLNQALYFCEVTKVYGDLELMMKEVEQALVSNRK